MSRIAAGSAEGAEQGYRPYLQAALLMGLFTFLFLCAEYLYVDVLSRMVSGDRAVLAQNEALGVSAVGFLLYPLPKFWAFICSNASVIALKSKWYSFV